MTGVAAISPIAVKPSGTAGLPIPGPTSAGAASGPGPAVAAGPGSSGAAITAPSQRTSAPVQPKGRPAGSRSSRRHAETLARKVQVHLPRKSGVVLQVGLAAPGKKAGGGMVLQLVDRVTHEVYFRMPPDAASPLVARLVHNGFGSGIFVNATA